MNYIILACVSFIVCYCIGASGFIDHAKQWAWKKFVKRPYPENGFTFKPFDCVKCMTFWTCLIVVIILNFLSFYSVTYVCILSLMAENIVLLQHTLNDLFGWLIYQVKKRLN